VSLPRFALDQNFPTPIIDALRSFIVEAEVVSVRDIDSRLSRLDDWQLLLALHHHSDRWEGLITTDSSMVLLPRELAVLVQTKLTLVIAEESGHDPLRATGLVLAHLPAIAKRTRPDVAQIWRLRALTPPHRDPWDELARVGRHTNTSARALFAQNKLTDEELAKDPLAT